MKVKVCFVFVCKRKAQYVIRWTKENSARQAMPCLMQGSGGIVWMEENKERAGGCNEGGLEESSGKGRGSGGGLFGVEGGGQEEEELKNNADM